MKEKQEKIWKKLESGNIYKFEEVGASLSGKFVSIEESKQYPNSYLVKLEQEDKSIIRVFVSNIVLDLLNTNNVTKGMLIKIVYTGMKKNEKGNFEYKTYEVFV